MNTLNTENHPENDEAIEISADLMGSEWDDEKDDLALFAYHLEAVTGRSCYATANGHTGAETVSESDWLAAWTGYNLEEQ